MNLIIPKTGCRTPVKHTESELEIFIRHCYVFWTGKRQLAHASYYGKSQYTAACVNCELSSWIMRVPLSVLYCLTVLLLTRCMDVEQNHGPYDGNCSTFMQAAQETIDTRFTQILHCVHHRSATLSRQMDKSFHSLGQTLRRIEEDVIRLNNEAQDDRMDVRELSRDTDKTRSRLDQPEKATERQETASRLKNL